MALVNKPANQEQKTQRPVGVDVTLRGTISSFRALESEKGNTYYNLWVLVKGCPDPFKILVFRYDDLFETLNEGDAVSVVAELISEVNPTIAALAKKKGETANPSLKLIFKSWAE